MTNDIYNNLDFILKNSARRTFISEDEYESFLMELGCEDLKKHNPNEVYVPGEKQIIYNSVKLKKKCQFADDKVISFVINYLIKISENLDNHGFSKISDIIDEGLEKINNNLNCKNCK